MIIEFTQYVRPDGEQRGAYVEATAEVAELAQEVEQAGGRFEMEPTSWGSTVYLTCVRDDKEHDDEEVVASQLASGPQMKEAVERLVKAAAVTLGLRTSAEDRRGDMIVYKPMVLWVLKENELGPDGCGTVEIGGARIAFRPYQGERLDGEANDGQAVSGVQQSGIVH